MIHPSADLSTDFKKLPHSKDWKGSYSLISLGCHKNTVDNERMMGLLKLDGYELISDPEQSDFVVVNTCGFIEAARQQSFGAIDEMLALKKACLLYTSPSPRDQRGSRMPSSA